MKTRIIISNNYNPYYNLSLESFLMDTIGDEVIMYLWQNQNTVVIGKNQNAWKECRTEILNEEGGILARRSSGGGAVFHDLGNLNFTFIAKKKDYDVKKQFKVIIKALKNLDCKVSLSGRNDMVYEDKKFSGNAFCQRGDVFLHHGTLLVNVDFNKLGRYLNPSKAKMKAKGVTSVKSRVINLSDINEKLTIENIKTELIESFSKIYAPPAKIEYVESDNTSFENSLVEYSSWEFIYGKTPKFDVNFSHKFDWAEIDFNFSMEKGIITETEIYSDAMDVQFIENLNKIFNGLPFSINGLKEALQNSSVSEYKEFCADISDFFEKLDI